MSGYSAYGHESFLGQIGPGGSCYYPGAVANHLVAKGIDVSDSTYRQFNPRREGVGTDRVRIHGLGSVAREKPSFPKLAAHLPPVVYYLRNREDLLKIGHTTDLANRRRQHGVPWSHILAITPGTLRDERTIHFRFARYVARGVEYYYPVAPMFDHIDQVRAAMGLGPVTRWTRSGPIASSDPRRYLTSR